MVFLWKISTDYRKKSRGSLRIHIQPSNGNLKFKQIWCSCFCNLCFCIVMGFCTCSYQAYFNCHNQNKQQGGGGGASNAIALILPVFFWRTGADMNFTTSNLSDGISSTSCSLLLLNRMIDYVTYNSFCIISDHHRIGFLALQVAMFWQNFSYRFKIKGRHGYVWPKQAPNYFNFVSSAECSSSFFKIQKIICRCILVLKKGKWEVKETMNASSALVRCN